jgi:delta 1-pyrroline-5-carboxylate dehydrogenase
LLPEFRNEPFTDFSVEANRKAFAEVLKAVQGRLPIQGKNRIGGKKVGAAKSFESVNPCDPRQVIGRFPAGTASDADRALDAATRAFPDWSRTTGWR